jgi:hypothetical protein
MTQREMDHVRDAMYRIIDHSIEAGKAIEAIPGFSDERREALVKMAAMIRELHSVWSCLVNDWEYVNMITKQRQGKHNDN